MVRQFLVFVAAVLCLTSARADEPSYQLPELSVFGMTPVLGSGIDKDRVPSNLQVVDPAQLKATNPASVADMLNTGLGSVSTADYQGNPLQPSLSFRGFTASPTLGEPQGLAVYQNGMRLNEAFGDLVNWDMNPSFAVDKIQVMPGANPVFGLNALGGAVVLKMKDGFSNPGSTAEIAGGSFGRARAMAETGQQSGPVAFYGGVSAQTDDGWRQSSPSKLIQSYNDVAVRKGDLDLGMGVTLAASSLAGLASTPIQLLQQSRSAVMTGPDLTQNAVAALEFRGSDQLSDSTSIQGNLYYRHLRSRTPNGNGSGFSACGDSHGRLCDSDGAVVTDRAGNPLSSTLGATGVINTTLTVSDGLGGGAQVSHEREIAGYHNAIVVGTSADQGWTDYHVTTELGQLSSARQVAGSDIFLGGPAYNLGLGAQNAYYGVYFTDTLSLTDRLFLTGAGRFNTASLHLHDQMGSGLDGDHHYQRFNPSLGVTWQIAGGLTSYVNYSEANRVPTAAELSCADPTRPCRVPNAFLSDPDLRQVVSRSVELGARGKAALGGAGKFEWSLAGYAARNDDDVIFVSSGAVIGSGYFANAGATERQGLEAGARLSLERWTLSANYGLVRAVFASDLALQSPFDIAADANGNIHVRPGDRMPGIPLHALKLRGNYAVSQDLSVGADASLSSDRVLRGDESNSMPKIPGYALVGADVTYKPISGVEAFLKVQNLFDRKFATAGIVGDPTGLFPAFTDPRFLTPGEPRSFWAGTRVTF